MYNIGEIQLPIFAGVRDSNTIHLDRFIGTGFFLDKVGTVATCKHVTQNIRENEFLLGKTLNDGRIHFLEKAKEHPTKDFALSKIPNYPTKYITHFKGNILTGLNIQTSGFTANGKNGKNLAVDLRFFKGYIVRTAKQPIRNDAYSLCETSFPIHKGFSGAPIISSDHGGFLVGMAYGNIESSILTHELVEIEKDGKFFKERIIKIIELGLIHTIDDIRYFLNEMEIPMN